jgi:DNA polymerase III epsilon subunit-like protein
MVDIETLGIEPGAVILSLGAVRFDDAEILDEFERNISLESCQEVGMEIDADTLEWWLGQDGDVQHVLTGGKPLDQVLYEFNDWYGDADEIWAFSPSFDCAHLADAYDRVGRSEPWSYRDERDCRTLVELPGAVDLEQHGNEHDALDDAKYQARTVMATLNVLEEEVGNR